MCPQEDPCQEFRVVGGPRLAAFVGGTALLVQEQGSANVSVKGQRVATLAFATAVPLSPVEESDPETGEGAGGLPFQRIYSDARGAGLGQGHRLLSLF